MVYDLQTVFHNVIIISNEQLLIAIGSNIILIVY
jgi:hypothetical protein